MLGIVTTLSRKFGPRKLNSSSFNAYRDNQQAVAPVQVEDGAVPNFIYLAYAHGGTKPEKQQRLLDEEKERIRNNLIAVQLAEAAKLAKARVDSVHSLEDRNILERAWSEIMEQEYDSVNDKLRDGPPAVTLIGIKPKLVDESFSEHYQVYAPASFWAQEIFFHDQHGNVILEDDRRIPNGVQAKVCKIKLANDKWGIIKWEVNDFGDAQLQYALMNEALPNVGSVRLLVVEQERKMYVTEMVENGVRISKGRDSQFSLENVDGYIPEMSINAIFQILLLNNELKQHGVDHADLHFANALLCPDNGHVSLIDYDAVVQYNGKTFEGRQIYSSNWKIISSIINFINNCLSRQGLSKDQSIQRMEEFESLLYSIFGCSGPKTIENFASMLYITDPLLMMRHTRIQEWFQRELGLDIGKYRDKTLEELHSEMRQILHLPPEQVDVHMVDGAVAQEQVRQDGEAAPVVNGAVAEGQGAAPAREGEAAPIQEPAGGQQQVVNQPEEGAVAQEPVPVVDGAQDLNPQKIGEFWSMHGAIQNEIDQALIHDEHDALSIALLVLRHPWQNSEIISGAIRENVNSASINVANGAEELMAHVDGFRGCLSSLTQLHVKDLVMRTCADIILSVGEHLNIDSTDDEINANLDIAARELDGVISILRSLLPKDKTLVDRLIAEINFAKAVLSDADKVKKFFKPNGTSIFHDIANDDVNASKRRREAVCERLRVIRGDGYNFSEDEQHNRLLERAKEHIKKTVEKERKFHRASFEAHKKYIKEKYGAANCKENSAGDLFYIDKKGYKKALVKSAWYMMGTHQKRVYAKIGEEFDEVAYRHYNSTIGLKVAIGVGVVVGASLIATGTGGVAACLRAVGAGAAASAVASLTASHVATIAGTAITGATASIVAGATVGGGSLISGAVKGIIGHNGKASKWKKTSYETQDGEAAAQIQGQVIDHGLHNRDTQQTTMEQSQFLQKGEHRTTQMRKSKRV